MSDRFCRPFVAKVRDVTPLRSRVRTSARVETPPDMVASNSRRFRTGDPGDHPGEPTCTHGTMAMRAPMSPLVATAPSHRTLCATMSP
eukprot:408429-Prorocentrum_minimum.AAC.1